MLAVQHVFEASTLQMIIKKYAIFRLYFFSINFTSPFDYKSNTGIINQFTMTCDLMTLSYKYDNYYSSLNLNIIHSTQISGECKLQAENVDTKKFTKIWQFWLYF